MIQLSIEIRDCIIVLRFAAVNNFVARKLNIAEATRHLYLPWKVDSVHHPHSARLFPAVCVMSVC